MSTDPHDADRVRRLRELFDGALNVATVDRAAWIARETQGDTALRSELESLITISETAESRLEAGAAPLIDAHRRTVEIEGQRLGAYHVLRSVGVGGMGDVYEAVRADDQYQQRVAIKVVRQGFGSDVSLARFRRERQILANLAHPNIATLFDGGVTPDGRPFLVMEFVEGAPITTWCDERRLGIRERLELFLQVCAAVAHAHKNLVIHSDIKPGNILVTADGVVKLLDFGIAKLIVGEPSDDTPVTRPDVRAFTPEYASPEQIGGEPLGTASDVYSLGVVLFELLAGRRPFAGRQSSPEIPQSILTADAPPPSGAVDDDAARHRGESAAKPVVQQLHGELDLITLMALRREPDRRYASVDALAEDLRNHLTGYPVSARRDSARYRLRKFATRNRGVVAFGALAIAAIITGSILALVQAHAARVERDRARFEEGRATQIASFLQGILGAGDVSWASPTRIPVANATVAQLLDSAARRLPHEISDEPLIRASLHRTIGRAYLMQSRTVEAKTQLDSALAIHRRLFGDDNAEAATDIYFLAPTSAAAGLDSIEHGIANAVAMMRRHRPDTIDSYVPAIHDLAYIKSARGQLAPAESLLSLVIREEEARPDPRYALLAITYGSLGLTHWNQGKQNVGIDEMKHGVALFDSLPVPSVAELAGALPTLATALVSAGRATEALPYLQRAKAATEQVYGPKAPGLVQIGVSLGDAYLATGDTARADKEALAGITLGESLPPGNEAERFQAEWTYTRSLRKQKRFEEAERFARRQYALGQKSVKEIPYFWADATFLLGAVLFDRGKAREAEPYLIDSFLTSRDKLGAQNVRTLRVLPLLVTTYDALARTSEVERYRALMPDSMRTRVDSVRKATSAAAPK